VNSFGQVVETLSIFIPPRGTMYNDMLLRRCDHRVDNGGPEK